ncbi:MAG: hypothetical protein M3452_06420, partial [Chloroflexota bacterium]|nr:hypothetical protein [Chloroflexota bacterium]
MSTTPTRRSTPATWLTLTPDGPLVDGSTGQTITVVGDLVADVPVGRYSYSARYADPAGPARGLEI